MQGPPACCPGSDCCCWAVAGRLSAARPPPVLRRPSSPAPAGSSCSWSAAWTRQAPQALHQAKTRESFIEAVSQTGLCAESNHGLPVSLSAVCCHLSSSSCMASCKPGAGRSRRVRTGKACRVSSNRRVQCDIVTGTTPARSKTEKLFTQSRVSRTFVPTGEKVKIPQVRSGKRNLLTRMAQDTYLEHSSINKFRLFLENNSFQSNERRL